VAEQQLYIYTNVDECARSLGQMLDATSFVPGLNTEALCQSLVNDVRFKSTVVYSLSERHSLFK